MVSSIGSANIASALLSQMTSNSGGVDFTALFAAQSGQGGAAVYSAASATVALKQAETQEDKQIAQTAKQPDVKRDLDRYAKVVKNAKSFDDVLNDPIARKVLMTAAGLGAYVDQAGLAKKAMMSDPDDPNSVAAKLSGTNGAWLQFARDYDIPKYGMDRLSPQNKGFAGKWTLDLQREGKPIEATLELNKTANGLWAATVNGVPVPAGVTGDTFALTVFWQDSTQKVHTSLLTGKLGKDEIITGPQSDDGKTSTNTWSAAPYFANSIKEVSDNYVSEKRLDMLDKQLPGLGTAVLFKQVAKDLTDPIKILGSAIGREVVTTALGLPKQLALQSLQAQTKAILQRMDPKKLADPQFADKIASRYLIMLNGGTGGITA